VLAQRAAGCATAGANQGSRGPTRPSSAWPPCGRAGRLQRSVLEIDVMASLTLNDIPDDLLTRLRVAAVEERRSLAEEVPRPPASLLAGPLPPRFVARYGRSAPMSMSTADDLYRIAKSLPVTERLRLVEKIAHDLTDASMLAVAPPPPGGSRAADELLEERDGLLVFTGRIDPASIPSVHEVREQRVDELIARTDEAGD
jgi:hypothetical protein